VKRKQSENGIVAGPARHEETAVAGAAHAPLARTIHDRLRSPLGSFPADTASSLLGDAFQHRRPSRFLVSTKNLCRGPALVSPSDPLPEGSFRAPSAHRARPGDHE
jgi:hypothetical protein